MRSITLLFALSLILNKGLAQQAILAGNSEETIHIGIPGEVQNADMANKFLNNIHKQTSRLVVVRDSIADLKIELEADIIEEVTLEEQAKMTEYQELLIVCDRMLATNERLLKGYLYIRSID